MKLFSFALIIIVLILAIVDFALGKLVCTDEGYCIHCSKSEMDEAYCKETGRKQKQICSSDRGTADSEDYRSCDQTKWDDRLEFMVFQFLMAIIGGLSFWVAKNRKQSQMTLFENRKQQNRNQRV